MLMIYIELWINKLRTEESFCVVFIQVPKIKGTNATGIQNPIDHMLAVARSSLGKKL